VKKYLYITFIIAILSPAFLACDNDDDLSSDSNLRLAFSSDLISFDTVFTTIGSATRQFKIYNHNSNSLVIQSIELMHPFESGFRMNIDGEKGTRLTNVEILKKDSLFGFIEVTVNPQNTSNPVLIRDSIRFSVNGKDQFLHLEAVGQDVYIWKDKRITKDSVIINTKPVLVYDSIVINQNVTATIEKGLTFFLKKDASVKVHGTLTANGTVDKPIIFRTDRFDKIEANIPYNNTPGQWDGIYFYPESKGNYLENTQVRSAERGMTFYPSYSEEKKADLVNVVVHNTSEYGVYTSGNKINAYNCLFSNSGGPLLAIYGGEYTFLHCTIANYYAWSNRRKESLLISNAVESSAGLRKCDFINSIIYGSANKELVLDKTTASPFNFSFTNCLIKSEVSTESEFINIVWNENPLFNDLNSERIFSYNFEPGSGPPTINKADRNYSVSLPFDIKGKSRLDDGDPDIGCYEWHQ